MHTTRLLQLLLAVVCIVCVSQATRLDVRRYEARNLARRQDVPVVGADASASASGNADPGSGTSSQSKQSDPVTPTSPTSQTTPPVTTTPKTTTAQKTTTSPKTTPTPTSPSSTPVQETTPSSTPPPSTSSKPDPSTSSQDEQTKTETTQPPVSTKVEVETKTNGDGSKSTMTTTSEITPTAGLNGKQGSGTSGMSAKTRNTIIGVVVGVGGAIVLGALSLVAWRIWGRRKQAEENDGLMAFDEGPPGAEKSEPGSSAGPPQRNPFQSTLENYHGPNTAPINSSSNF